MLPVLRRVCPRPLGLPLLAVLGGLLLGGGAAGAEPGATARLSPFFGRTVRASTAGLDTLAGGFNVAQLPLLAAAVAADERAGAPPSASAYEALTRWHFWLGQRLDPAHRGLWSAQRPWLPIPSASAATTVAPLAALELVHLQALAEMATRRGQSFDALVWWRDRSVLRQRLLHEMYDPLRGGYVDLDSTGHRSAMGENLAPILPMALGASSLPNPSARLSWRLLVGADPDTLSAESVRARALDRLDPLGGWPQRPGLDFLPPETIATLLRHAMDGFHDPDLRRLTDSIFPTLGFAERDTVRLSMGAARLPLPLGGLHAEPLGRTRVVLEFLQRVGAIDPDEIAALRRTLDAARDDPRSVAGALGDALATWRARDLEAERSRLRLRRAELPPVNGEGEATAFRWREADARVWIDAALALLAEDVLALHLEGDDFAGYRAWVDPPVAGRGDRTVLRLRHREKEAAREALTGRWQAGWTDGRRLLGMHPLQLRSIDERLSAADLPPAPDETGNWWLLVRGPHGRPMASPGLAVVEPLAASLQALSNSEPSGRQAYVLTLRSQVLRTLGGRVEILPPDGWSSDTPPEEAFRLGAGEQETRVLRFDPPEEAAPALYPLTVRVFDESQLVGELDGSLPVHFRWLRVGPLPVGPDLPLQASHGPDRSLDLGQRYRGPKGVSSWQRMPSRWQGADGWVQLAPADGPAGLFYALTAFSTTSREVTVRLESPNPALLRVNGEEVLRLEGFRRGGAGEARLTPGTNYLLVKLAAGEGHAGRFRLSVRDVDGEPLHAVSNALEQLLDGYAYLRGGDGPAASPEHLRRQTLRLVPIRYENPRATSVSVVGSFNGWSPTATPMAPLGDGRWVAEIRVEPGRFEYKLAVDGSNWIADPANPVAVDDGFGGRSSVLVVE